MDIIDVSKGREWEILNFEKLKPYVREAGEKTVNAPNELPVRYLIAYQIILVIAGRATIHAKDRDYEIAAGDCVFLQPNEPHSYTITENFRELHVSFDTTYSELSRVRNVSSSIPPDQRAKHFQKYLQINIYEDYDLPLVFKPENFDEYLGYFHDIKTVVKKNNSFVAEIKMLKLLNLIHDRLGIKKVKATVDICEAVKDYIDANFEEALTLDDIAALYEVNKFTALRKFKKRYGVGIIEYYNVLRLDFAKKSLQKPEHNITYVSEQLHFTDVYTFSKFFKSHTGLSPRAYKVENSKK